jgi:CheY-like chemotaxis protein
MHYHVALNAISENDQLVLRLIFSLSAKVKGRAHTYTLHDPSAGTPADITIVAAPQTAATDNSSQADTIWLATEGTTSMPDATTIYKPLIASRVLTVLDRHVEQQPRAQITAAPQPEPTAASADPQLEFCISEEEATELAIVDDEALSNPANADIDPTASNPSLGANTYTEPRPSASLLVLHNNKEREVSRHAFDARATQTAETKPRALVVDDSPSVRKQLELELDLFHVEVDYADSVATATTQLQQHHYDLVFLDVVLPDGDGFGICRSLRANANRVPVIMLTGKASPADKIKGTMAGCDAYLVKPVGRMTFQNTVCNYLQLREQLEVIHA